MGLSLISLLLMSLDLTYGKKNFIFLFFYLVFGVDICNDSVGYLYIVTDKK